MPFASSALLQPTVEAAWRATLGDLLEGGETLAGDKPSIELLGYDVAIENPRCRLIGNEIRPLPLIPAIARFAWMMAGNERLEDIAFYEPMVRGFTDDDLTVPGSNYGARLRRSHAGDQVEAAIERLRDGDSAVAGADGKLRRAANVIWKPEDASRTSSDIPCAFGLFYFPRGGRLTTQLVMRSNNAVALLPFNLFEFTLLAEIVATEAGMEPGPFRVDAMSMHLYLRDEERAREILDAPSSGEGEMPAIPPGSKPLEQVNLLAQREANLRHQQRALANESLDEALARGEGLDSYWRPFFDVLLATALVKAERPDAAREVARGLPGYFSGQVLSELDRRAAQAEPNSDLRLFSPHTPGETPPMPDSAAVAESLRAGSVSTEHLHALLDEIERSDGTRIGHREAAEVHRFLEEKRVDVAARSEEDGSADDRGALDRAEVRDAIDELGFGR